MTLRNRYRRLNLWNKLGAWGSLASLVGVIGIPLAIYSLFFQPAPQLHVTLDDVYDRLKAQDANFEKDPHAAYTFWLLRDPGASIALGTCPGPKCLQFILGSLRTGGDSLIQEIFLSGAGSGIQFRSESEPGLVSRINGRICVKGSGLNVNWQEEKVWVPLALARGNFFEMTTKVADISFRVLDTRSDSLRIHLEVRRGTYVPLEQGCGKRPTAR
jgi:hypothetical protein